MRRIMHGIIPQEVALAQRLSIQRSVSRTHALFQEEEIIGAVKLLRHVPLLVILVHADDSCGAATLTIYVRAKLSPILWQGNYAQFLGKEMLANFWQQIHRQFCLMRLNGTALSVRTHRRHEQDDECRWNMQFWSATT